MSVLLGLCAIFWPGAALLALGALTDRSERWAKRLGSFFPCDASHDHPQSG